MVEKINLTSPLSEADVSGLKVGDSVSLSGIIYSARDVAHKRLVELLDRGESLPFDLNGAVIYYVGPSPAKPGKVIGSAGPTTSYRMDPFVPRLTSLGLRGMIGKGVRDRVAREAMVKNKAVYFVATGGAAALISRCIVSCEVIAFDDLGPEAIRRMEVKDFPLVVGNDVYGGDIYEKALQK